MKTLFDYIDNIQIKKQFEKLEPQNAFSAYMAQRWISMYSPEICFVLNETYNKQWAALSNPQMSYDYMICRIPKLKRKKVEYFKKKKIKSEDVISLATKLEISRKEAKDILKFLDKDNEKKESLEIFVQKNKTKR